MTYKISYCISGRQYIIDVPDMDAVVFHIDALCKKHRRLILCQIHPVGVARYALDFA